MRVTVSDLFCDLLFFSIYKTINQGKSQIDHIEQMNGERVKFLTYIMNKRT